MFQSHENTESGSGQNPPDSPESESDRTPLFPNDGMCDRFVDFDNPEKNGEHKLMEELLKQIFHQSNRKVDALFDRDKHSFDDDDDDDDDDGYSDEDSDPIIVLQPGDSFGPFLIRHYIAHGGFGIVYKANDGSKRLDVALKVPRTDRMLNKKAMRRFHREARMAFRLQHPSIISVQDVGHVDGVPYMTSAFETGKTLREWIRKHPNGLPLELCVEWAINLTSALDYLHQNGVVHRDLKPSNIIIAKRDHQTNSKSFSYENHIPKITDFGLGYLLKEEQTQDSLSEFWLGTPSYMSPEQVLSANIRVDIRSDIYAIGLILGEMLNGQKIRLMDSVGELMMNLCHDKPILELKNLQSRIPPKFMDILCKCLEEKPENRYQSPFDLHNDLKQFQESGVFLYANSGRSRIGSKLWTRVKKIFRSGQTEF
jgi:serine/threonine protein kinase